MKKMLLLSCLLVSSYSWALSVPVESGASASYSFGETIEVGASVADKTFNFKRSSGATENAGSTVSLSSSADFSVVSATGCNKELIKTSETCYVKVRFLKKVAGTYSATLQVGSPGALNEIVISASVLAPVVPAYSLSLKDGSVAVSSSVDYGPLNKNTSITKTFTLTNSGAQPAPLAVALSGSGYIISNNSCSTSLAKSSSCYFKITFSAGAGSASDESKPGSLAINQDMVIDLAALVRGTPVVTGSPSIKFYESSLEISSLNYGLVSSGNLSKIFTVKNVGTAVASSAVSLSGDAAFVQSSNNCPAALAVNASCQVRVNLVYSASSLGDKAASISSSGSSLALSGRLGTATYTATYSDPVNNLAVCAGSSNASKILSSCVRDHDQAVVSNSLCPGPAPTVTLQSPAGNKNVSIDHGSKIVSCALGSSSESHVSTSCDQGYESLSAGVCSVVSGPTGSLQVYLEGATYKLYKNSPETVLSQGSGQSTLGYDIVGTADHRIFFEGALPNDKFLMDPRFEISTNGGPFQSYPCFLVEKDSRINGKSGYYCDINPSPNRVYRIDLRNHVRDGKAIVIKNDTENGFRPPTLWLEDSSFTVQVPQREESYGGDSVYALNPAAEHKANVRSISILNQDNFEDFTIGNLSDVLSYAGVSNLQDNAPNHKQLYFSSWAALDGFIVIHADLVSSGGGGFPDIANIQPIGPNQVFMYFNSREDMQSFSQKQLTIVAQAFGEYNDLSYGNCQEAGYAELYCESQPLPGFYAPYAPFYIKATDPNSGDHRVYYEYPFPYQ